MSFYFFKFGVIFIIFQSGIINHVGSTVVGERHLVNLRTQEGEIRRDEGTGTPVFFDAPLRASKDVSCSSLYNADSDFQNAGQISVEIDNEAASQAFGVFPTVLSPGDPFTLILRDSSLIPVMEDDNIFQVPVSVLFPILFSTFEFQIKVKYLNDPSDEGEKFSLLVRILDPEHEIPRVQKTEYTFRLTQRLTEGIVGKIEIENLNKTDLTKFKYELFGGFTDL